MQRRERPRIREGILRNGMRPRLGKDGFWDGYGLEDDGSGSSAHPKHTTARPSAPTDRMTSKRSQSPMGGEAL
jgi:hypothetical protein